MLSDFTIYILTALALVLVIEGLIYALFTDSVRKIMAIALTLPPQTLRNSGFILALLGLTLLLILQKLSQ